MQYAVRGPIVIRAVELEKEIAKVGGWVTRPFSMQKRKQESHFIFILVFLSL